MLRRQSDLENSIVGSENLRQHPLRECRGQRDPVNAALAGQLLALVDRDRHAGRGLNQQAALGQEPCKQHPVPMFIGTLGDEVFDGLLSPRPQGDHQADDRGRASDDGGSAARPSSWAMAHGAPPLAAREPSARLLPLRPLPPERPSRGLCAIRVRAWPYSVDQDRAGLDGVQECCFRPGEPVLHVFC